MFLKILLAFVVLVGALVVFIATRPSDFRITRSATIAAAPETLFTQVNDLHRWNSWSPWAKIDPNAKQTFSGPPAGVGASSTWAGNNEVGEGRMTITESRPNDLVQLRLEFFKPFQATNVAEFTFQPEGAQTLVTWTMTGKNNFIAKAFGLVVDCDKMVGGQFEQGLAQLRATVDSPAP
jgi:uncharacterized protein YndB with AHSA1/START domain